jgi:hypothetical protein
MFNQKKVTSLGHAIENELRNLERLDPFAWRQIGDYMGKVRERVNAFVARAETEKMELESLCASLKEVDKLCGGQMEPRVLRLLAAERERIGKSVRAGLVRLEPISGDSEAWPKVRAFAFPPITLDETPIESEEELMSNWAKNGFPID